MHQHETTMGTWDAFSAAAPTIAAAGRQLIERSGTGEGLLATVCGDAPPRIHPVHVRIVDGRLLTFVMAGSGKTSDLAGDGRYALHAHQDPLVPHEFLIRGRAVEVADPARRASAAAEWSFEVDDTYRLYDLSVDHVVLGERGSAEEWPPVYSSWRAG
jgi:hypothetical protein